MNQQEVLAQALHDTGAISETDLMDGGVPDVCNHWPEHERLAAAILAALRENGYDIGVMVDEDWEADIRQQERKRLRAKHERTHVLINDQRGVTIEACPTCYVFADPEETP